MCIKSSVLEIQKNSTAKEIVFEYLTRSDFLHWAVTALDLAYTK